MNATKLENHLRGMQKHFNEQKAKNFPFNERELAKGELVRSLVKHMDAGTFD